jgi:ISXO2-like transposase domain
MTRLAPPILSPFVGQTGLPARNAGLSVNLIAFRPVRRPERDAIGGAHPIEVDECYIGGETRGEGRGTHHKATVIGAVEVRPRKNDGKAHKRSVYAGRLRLRVVPDRGTEALTDFVKESIMLGAIVMTGGWGGYQALPNMGYHREALVLNGDPDKAEAHLPMIHLVFSNLKTWIKGTHHGRIEPKHLQAYLNEYVFRFNRRFYPMTAFHSVLGIAARSVPPTYAQLYSGEWEHAA